MSNQMWLPKTETKVTVTQDGTVNVWDEMTMELRSIPRTGFISSAADRAAYETITVTPDETLKKHSRDI